MPAFWNTDEKLESQDFNLLSIISFTTYLMLQFISSGVVFGVTALQW